MTVVWKETVDWQRLTGVMTFHWPEGAEAVSAAEQFGQVSIWYRCDPRKPKVERKIIVVGTGHECPKHARHFSTLVTHSGQFVWHLFDDWEGRLAVVMVPTDIADRDVTEPVMTTVDLIRQEIKRLGGMTSLMKPKNMKLLRAFLAERGVNQVIDLEPIAQEEFLALARKLDGSAL